jgi:Rieske Fe-S protein
VSEPISEPAAAPEPSRRNWLAWLGVGLGGLAALAAGLPFVGYLLGPLFRKPPDSWTKWLDLDPIDKFPLNETRLHVFTNPIRTPWDGMTAQTGAYVRRTGPETFDVFAVNCTHLGCPVSWFPQSGLFMCPCHGGVYYEDGRHASGPPPRPLYRYQWRVVNGRLEVKPPHLPTLHDPLAPQDKA